MPIFAILLTNSLVAGMKQLSEWSSGALLFYDLSTLLVSRQFTQDAGSDSLDVLYLVEQQLHEHRDHVLLSDQCSVECFSG